MQWSCQHEREHVIHIDTSGKVTTSRLVNKYDFTFNFKQSPANITFIDYKTDEAPTFGNSSARAGGLSAYSSKYIMATSSLSTQIPYRRVLRDACSLLLILALQPSTGNLPEGTAVGQRIKAPDRDFHPAPSHSDSKYKRLARVPAHLPKINTSSLMLLWSRHPRKSSSFMLPIYPSVVASLDIVHPSCPSSYYENKIYVSALNPLGAEAYAGENIVAQGGAYITQVVSSPWDGYNINIVHSSCPSSSTVTASTMLLFTSLVSLVGVTAALDASLSGIRRRPSFFDRPLKETDSISPGMPRPIPDRKPRNVIVDGVDSFQPIHVEVYANIVSSSNSTEHLSLGALENQIQIVNHWFGPLNMSFSIVETRRIVDDTWATGDDSFNMVIHNHQGTSASLNLFIIETITSSDLVGICTYPNAVEYAPKVDGCVLVLRAIPGAPESATGYDAVQWQGKALIHEIGHWFGLRETFHRGCDGDEIDDIPASLPSHGCPVGLDSCPDKPGLDPIHNFMSHNNESCKREFSAGQIRRMHHNWHRHRAQARAAELKGLPLLKPFLEQVGKLPFYENYEKDVVMIFALCARDHHGVVRERDERRCGSYWYCHFGLYRTDENAAGSWHSKGECLRARALSERMLHDVELEEQVTVEEDKAKAV
ncbi:hypothetical protein L249_7730 [Ophiocordyceps polyrhachis-furcata BCC 54312]|uniref:Peptidase M43 pregnancy-associated plasma-A domain-containing protein n=1 Tax=Ophiocordyceps polyrhachis-furcata BCC 54312 TaxID=1330021 RepID=A0A367LAU8_9HYPO|nr:hypothetical protein L249_7730 [Ophiocordyceps polyrhachis-furcata BCC 54312]